MIGVSPWQIGWIACYSRLFPAFIIINSESAWIAVKKRIRQASWKKKRMENSDHERAQSRPLYCRAEACPVEGFLEVFLSNGGCIFCQGGLCSASPLILAMFSIAATSQEFPETADQAGPADSFMR